LLEKVKILELKIRKRKLEVRRMAAGNLDMKNELDKQAEWRDMLSVKSNNIIGGG
jgi:hypothetical protein